MTQAGGQTYAQVGAFAQPIGPEKVVRNEQGRRIGMIRPGRDAFGNAVFLTVSDERLADTLISMTEGATRFWLWSLDETYGGQRMRGVRP